MNNRRAVSHICLNNFLGFKNVLFNMCNYSSDACESVEQKNEYAVYKTFIAKVCRPKTQGDNMK